jgi:hypothetical protein
MIVTHKQQRLCMTTLVLLHTGVGEWKAHMRLLALDGMNAELAGVFQVTLFCPVHAEQRVLKAFWRSYDLLLCPSSPISKLELATHRET